MQQQRDEPFYTPPGMGINPIMRHFQYAHLPEHLKRISKPICEMAQEMYEELPDGAEKDAGLRKLLEAKDCFVRAKLG